MSEQTSSRTETTTGGLRIALDPRNYAPRHYLGLAGLVFLAALPYLFQVPVVSDALLTISPANEASLVLGQIAGALFIAMFAMSWDFASGYTGEISFGHGLFFGVGGYTAVLLNLGWEVPLLLAIPAGVVMAVVAGAIIGLPSLRLEGPYFSLITLVAPLILLQLFVYRADVFGGRFTGVSGANDLVAFEMFSEAADPILAYTRMNYYLTFALFVAIMVVALAITRSNTGSILTAIRENVDAVASVGLNPAKFKVFAFMFSAAMGGLAGAVYVHTPFGSATPAELVVLTVSINVIIASVLGGMGTIVGPALGGLFVGLVPEYLSSAEQIPVLPAELPILGPIAEADVLIFATLTLVLLFVFPGGVLRWGIGIGRGVLSRIRGGGGDGEEPVATDGGRAPVAAVRERWRESLRRPGLGRESAEELEQQREPADRHDGGEEP